MATDDNGGLAVQVAELRVEMRTELRHVKEDIAEIKTDLRDFKKSTEERFTRLEGAIHDIRADLRSFKSELREELAAQIGSVKLWTFGMYVAFAGTLLYVVAKSAKWL